MPFGPGILRESDSQDGRLILWLPAERDGRYQFWHRVSTVPHAAVARHKGFCAVRATMLRAGQPIRGFFATFVARFRRDSEDHAWLLPNGKSAERCGDRQGNLLLVWAEDDSKPVDEKRIKECWPQITQMKPLGPNLYLLWDAADTPPEQSLAAPRFSGERSDEARALTDLRLSASNDGNVGHTTARRGELLGVGGRVGRCKQCRKNARLPALDQGH